MISQKIHNYNYAPGLATYGKLGNAGNDGINGNYLLYTDYSLEDENDIKEFALKIKDNYLPLRNSTTSINRTYQNGDYFFDNTGTIYELYNYETLFTLETYIKDNFLKIAGKINIAKNDFFSLYQNRLCLDTSSYNGFDIIPAGLSDLVDSNYVTNIISNNIDDDNNINFVNMIAINDKGITDGNLKIYYNTLDNAYHISSELPIILNTSTLKINTNTTIEDTDDYAGIVSNKDTITLFKLQCNNITYSYDNNINKMYFSNYPSSFLNNPVYVKIYYILDQTAEIYKFAYQIEYSTEIGSANVVVSLLYNSEVIIRNQL